MIRKNEVYKIGVLGKPHGIHGEIQFNFTDDIFDRVDCDYIICMMDGILVPFFIEEYRFRSDVMALLKLEGVDSSEQARRFTNIDVYFPIKEAEGVNEDDLTWDFFVGFEILDTVHGTLGKVTEVENSTVNTLFVVDHLGQELLIPAQEDFIEKIDSDKRIICMNLPEGLVRLDDADSDED